MVTMRPVLQANSTRTLQPLIRSRAQYQKSRLRSFTQNTQLLRLTKSPLRPQIPFLNPNRSSLSASQAHWVRSFFTEQRKRWRENSSLLVKCYTILFVVLTCNAMLLLGMRQRKFERQFPEPPDFTWMAKWWYRTAKGSQRPGEAHIVDWLDAGKLWNSLIVMLENPKEDGAGVKPILARGDKPPATGLIVETSFDVTAKPEPWRRGYFEALMGAAKAAEHLYGWFQDKTREGVAYPPEVVIGPSNPQPRPVGRGMPEAPKEENCVPAFQPPELFYNKILTGEGFTSGQKLEAALTYADCLQVNGMSSLAADMIDQGLSIAIRNAPPGIVDEKTGTITDGATGVTENIFLATSALAMHKTQVGDLAAALPIYLSILRAQRTFPLEDPALYANSRPSKKATESWYDRMVDALALPPFPEAPPTGDEPATRKLSANCDEAANMAHIGEILYASSFDVDSVKKGSFTKSQELGLSWTRDAIELAESTFGSVSQGPPLPAPVPGMATYFAPLPVLSEEEKARDRCIECLAMAVENWKKMVDLSNEAESRSRHQNDAQVTKPMSQWLWNTSTARSPSRWELEKQAMEAKVHDLERHLQQEGLQFDHS